MCYAWKSSDRCLGLFAESYKTSEYSAWLGISPIGHSWGFICSAFSTIFSITFSTIICLTWHRPYWPFVGIHMFSLLNNIFPIIFSIIFRLTWHLPYCWPLLGIHMLGLLNNILNNILNNVLLDLASPLLLTILGNLYARPSQPISCSQSFPIFQAITWITPNLKTSEKRSFFFTIGSTVCFLTFPDGRWW